MNFQRLLQHHTALRAGVLVAFLFLLAAVIIFTTDSNGIVRGGEYPELKEAAELPADFNTVSDFFKAIAEEKGGGYAFEILKRADLPPNMDLHLLGHIVGDELYKQEGVEGIKICTNDFRNACSHTIVIGALLQHGEGALEDIQEACYRAPGGKGAYTMCFHGLGHGVLAYLDYEFEDAVAFCKQVGTQEYYQNEYTQCVGGAMMEMIAGVHDRATWEKKREKYFKDDDPLYPCNAEFVPADARPLCYAYLTPNLFSAVGANMANPQPDDFAAAFALCAEEPDENLRHICYGAFGKEFVVLAQDRDIRDVASMSNERLATVGAWCALAGDSIGADECVRSAVQSLYWGGENDRNGAVRFCSLLEGQSQDACVDELIGAVNRYIDDVPYRRAFCDELPDAYGRACTERLL